MKLTRAQLLPGLRRLVRDGNGPVDLSALLFALALWESGGELGATGDDGESVGFLQVHLPDWQELTGGYDRDRATSDDWRAALRYEVSFAQPVIRDTSKAINAALREAARRAKKRERLVFSPIRDLPVWGSISWQYGSDTLLRFVRASRDLSSDGFKRWQEDLQPDHESRQAFVRGTYLKALRDPMELLESLREVSVETGVDFFTNAARKLGVDKSSIREWSLGQGAKLVRANIKGGSAGILGLAVGAGLLYAAATESDGDGGRRLTKETKQEVGTVVGGIALAVMASRGLG